MSQQLSKSKPESQRSSVTTTASTLAYNKQQLMEAKREKSPKSSEKKEVQNTSQQPKDLQIKQSDIVIEDQKESESFPEQESTQELQINKGKAEQLQLNNNPNNKPENDVLSLAGISFSNGTVPSASQSLSEEQYKLIISKMKNQNDKLRGELKFLNQKLTVLIQKSKPALYRRDRARNSENIDSQKQLDVNGKSIPLTGNQTPMLTKNEAIMKMELENAYQLIKILQKQNQDLSSKVYDDASAHQQIVKLENEIKQKNQQLQLMTAEVQGVNRNSNSKHPKNNMESQSRDQKNTNDYDLLAENVQLKQKVKLIQREADSLIEQLADKNKEYIELQKLFKEFSATQKQNKPSTSTSNPKDREIDQSKNQNPNSSRGQQKGIQIEPPGLLNEHIEKVEPQQDYDQKPSSKNNQNAADIQIFEKDQDDDKQSQLSGQSEPRNTATLNKIQIQIETLDTQERNPEPFELMPQSVQSSQKRQKNQQDDIIDQDLQALSQQIQEQLHQSTEQQPAAAKLYAGKNQLDIDQNDQLLNDFEAPPHNSSIINNTKSEEEGEEEGNEVEFNKINFEDMKNRVKVYKKSKQVLDRQYKSQIKDLQKYIQKLGYEYNEVQNKLTEKEKENHLILIQMNQIKRTPSHPPNQKNLSPIKPRQHSLLQPLDSSFVNQNTPSQMSPVNFSMSNKHKNQNSEKKNFFINKEQNSFQSLPQVVDLRRLQKRSVNPEKSQKHNFSNNNNNRSLNFDNSIDNQNQYLQEHQIMTSQAGSNKHLKKPSQNNSEFNIKQGSFHANNIINNNYNNLQNEIINNNNHHHNNNNHYNNNNNQGQMMMPIDINNIGYIAQTEYLLNRETPSGHLARPVDSKSQFKLPLNLKDLDFGIDYENSRKFNDRMYLKTQYTLKISKIQVYVNERGIAGFRASYQNQENSHQINGGENLIEGVLPSSSQEFEIMDDDYIRDIYGHVDQKGFFQSISFRTPKGNVRTFGNDHFQGLIQFDLSINQDDVPICLFSTVTPIFDQNSEVICGVLTKIGAQCVHRDTYIQSQII